MTGKGQGMMGETRGMEWLIELCTQNTPHGATARDIERIAAGLKRLRARLATVTERQIDHGTATGSQICIGRHSPADTHWYVESGGGYLMPDREGLTTIEDEAGLWPEDEAEGIVLGMVGR